MSVVVHAFPSVHGFNARSLFLALIIGLHVAFFWALSSGLSPGDLLPLPKRSTVIDIPTQIDATTLPEPLPVEVAPIKPVLKVPMPVIDTALPREEGMSAQVMDEITPPLVREEGSGPTISEPAVTEPRIAGPLVEPEYPTAEIRLNRTGTVVLSVRVMTDGSIGEVKIDRSSGFTRLDQAAVRAARQWKLVPGTRDGEAVPMWKQIPVTFQLK